MVVLPYEERYVTEKYNRNSVRKIMLPCGENNTIMGISPPSPFFVDGTYTGYENLTLPLSPHPYATILCAVPHGTTG